MRVIKKFLKLIIFLAVVGALIFLAIRTIKHKKAQEAKIPTAKVYPVVVNSIEVKPSDVELTLPYLGLVQNENNIKLSSRISGRVLQIKKSGQKVKKGEVLVKLDTTEIDANLNSLKITLNNLYKTHQRTKALYKVKAASIEQLQNEESKIASLQAKIDALKNQLSYAVLTSPGNGLVSKSYVSVGSVSMPGHPLLDISTTEGFSLLVRVPDSIKPKSIIYKKKIYPLQKLGSTFHRLNEYKAFVNDPNLSDGESVEVQVVAYKGKGTKLPFDSLLNRDGKSYVLLIQKDKVTPKEVHIIQSGEEGVVIKENLQNQKLVLAKPDIMLKLLSGVNVKVKD